ncbi:MAG: M20/M25/M40 family metallo-hydrolase [Betaproteobacteria bacterium]
MKKALALALVLGVGAAVAAQPAADPMLATIRAEGLQHSQAAPVFEMLTVDIGPRLTNSPAFRRAVAFVRDRLASYGLANVHEEPWHFGRGWTLEKLTVEMVEPRYMPLIGYAEAWSPSTSGDIVAAPVFVGDKTPEAVSAMRDQLQGAIVMTQPLMTRFVRRDRPQPTDPDAAPSEPNASAGSRPPAAAQKIAQAVREAGAAVQLRPSIGEHGTVFVTGRDGGPGAVPSVVLSAEHYNMIVRMLERHVPVKLRIGVQTRYYDQQDAANVIAEIPGVDPALRDEVVMFGAHLDSWHTGVGATDNADGATTVIEAMRILKAAGVRPRRTIRVALWGGEEQGLLGSRAWVAQHLAGDANRAARQQFDVYFNIDNGYGPIYGFYCENNAAVKPLFDTWLAPFTDIGARKNVIEGIGATDHVTFDRAGVPAFNPIQSYRNYDVRTHHTNMDTVDRVNEDDLRQAAVVMASFVYHAAMADARIPRRP